MDTNDAFHGESRGDADRRREEEAPWDGGGTAERSGQERADTIRTFALWMLAHYTGRPDDRVQVASHGGLTVSRGMMEKYGGGFWSFRFRTLSSSPQRCNPTVLVAYTGGDALLPHSIAGKR